MAIEGDLILEDGTGFEDSNTYSLIADGDTYHSLLGNEQWTDCGSDEKATALVNATRYMGIRWCFIGEITNPTDGITAGQALSWPRQFASGVEIEDSEGNVIPVDSVPPAVINACLEYALEYLKTGPLLKTPADVDDAGRFVTLEREKLGPLESETRYSESKGQRIKSKYAVADRIIRDSGLSTSAGGGSAIRA